MLAALAAEYLRRMSAADEVVLGVPYMGRLGNASARVPAMVKNVLPLRVAAGEGSVEAFTPAWAGSSARVASMAVTAVSSCAGTWGWSARSSACTVRW